jgi:hypothetical protein
MSCISLADGLRDIVGTGKRQLNQLMTFLDKSNTMKDGAGGRSAEASLRVIRVKREMDDAGAWRAFKFRTTRQRNVDQEYRKGVYRLETLRLRRVKTLQAGYNVCSSFVRIYMYEPSLKSLERFYLEAGEAVKKALVSYTDNMLCVPFFYS